MLLMSIGFEVEGLIGDPALQNPYREENLEKEKQGSPRSGSRIHGQRYPRNGGRPERITDFIRRKTLSIHLDCSLQSFSVIAGKGFPEFLEVFAGNQNSFAEKSGSQFREEEVKDLEVNESFRRSLRQVLFSFRDPAPQPGKRTFPAQDCPGQPRQSGREGQPRPIQDESLLQVIDGFSIQKDGFHPIAEVFGAQTKMISEEGLDTDPDAGLDRKSLLQEGEKGRDLARREIEL
jgi:hypothetical protein